MIGHLDIHRATRIIIEKVKNRDEVCWTTFRIEGCGGPFDEFTLTVFALDLGFVKVRTAPQRYADASNA